MLKGIVCVLAAAAVLFVAAMLVMGGGVHVDTIQQVTPAVMTKAQCIANFVAQGVKETIAAGQCVNYR